MSVLGEVKTPRWWPAVQRGPFGGAVKIGLVPGPGSVSTVTQRIYGPDAQMSGGRD